MSQLSTKSNHKYTKSVPICMVEGEFSSLRSEDCQAFFVKALIPVPFATGERRFQMTAPRFAIEFFIY